MKHLEKYIGIGMLLFAIGFNLWIYRLEPTALTDPNDNTFQFALVDRTNQIWSFAQQKCSSQFGAWNLVLGAFCQVSYLADHWVPNWAGGYNLPYYYSHLPQILIVASWRVFSWFSSLFTIHYSLFTFYHWIIYLLLSLFPLSMFIALRVIGVSWVASGIGALVATQLSTDGLYGLDPPSFLWRGYGLSSQLFAMIWLPLALAYAWRGKVIPTIVTLAAVTAGHLGIGVIGFLSVAIVGITRWKKLPVIFGGVLLLLGYWILPILINGNYHNISVWDGIWKFDSFGFREVLKNFFNGDLFDFGRLPVLTGLVFVGFFAALQAKTLLHGYIATLNNANVTMKQFNNEKDNDNGQNGHSYYPFSLLFVFWLVMYFGRTTWGSLVDLIPGMTEFHLSRFIVGIHIAGLFLIPMGIEWIVSRITDYGLRITKFPFIRLLAYSFISLFVYSLITPQTLRYSSHNDFLIKRGNENYMRDKEDVSRLFSVVSDQLSVRPGRVFAGRGGSWGKDFRIAETPMFMHLSTYGIPVILWLPETWSPNSDTEQYFSESNPAHYALYNVRYVVTPTELAKEHMQPFWKLIETGKTWKLYEVTQQTDNNVTMQQLNNSFMGYITTGFRPAIVSSSKQDFRSVVRLWMHSDYLSQGVYPELIFDSSYPKDSGLPNFRMLNETTYKVPDGSTHNLFSEVPRYQLPITNYQLPTILSQESNSDMIFKATLEVKNDCMECLVVLKQSFHPSWRATIDGEPAKTFAVFPFYTAVTVENPGTHEVVFSYEPSPLKQFLLAVSLISLLSLLWLARPNNLQKFNPD